MGNVVNHDLQTAANEVSALRITFRDNDKPNLVLLDTPGSRNEHQIGYSTLLPVVNWLNAAGTSNSTTKENTILRKVSGILYLHRITDNRFAGGVAENFELFKKFCPEEFYKRIILTTTMWPNEGSPGYSLELRREYETCEQTLKVRHWQDMITLGSEARRFTGTSRSAQEIVNLIVKTERSRLIEVIPVTAHELKDDDIVIVVMGPTGVGKSTFIQTAVEEHYRTNEVGHQLGSATIEVSALRLMFKGGDKPNIVLVDTPGFDDTYANEVDILETIVNWLDATGSTNSRTGKDGRVSGILYLHRITDIRFSGSVAVNFELFKKLCGEDFYKRVILTTTMWPDENNPAYSLELKKEYEKREQELKDNHWGIMIKSGSKVSRFTKTLHSVEKLVNEIVEIENRNQEQPMMRIQLELMSKSLWETQAGEYIRKIRNLLKREKFPPPRLFKEFDFTNIDKVMPISARDLLEDDMIIVVMGPPLAGKSTFIQTVAGAPHNHVGAGEQQSATGEVSALRISFRGPSNTNVVFVDTPGFGRAGKTDLQTLATIAKWFKDTGLSDYKTRESADLRRISGFIYLYPITNIGTPVDTIQKSFEMFQKLCGRGFCDRVILTTTMWPGERDAAYWPCVYRQKTLEASDWRRMIAWGSKVCRFDKTLGSAEAIVNKIVIAEREKRERLLEQVVQIQKELVRELKPLPNTQAGQHLRAILNQLVQQQSKELKQLKQDLKSSAGLDVELSIKLDRLQRAKEENERDIITLKPRSLPSQVFSKIRRSKVTETLP